MQFTNGEQVVLDEMVRVRNAELPKPPWMQPHRYTRLKKAARRFLPQHRGQLTRTEQLIAQAEADGRRRLVEMNEPVRLNLLRIIDGLDTLEDSDGG